MSRNRIKNSQSLHWMGVAKWVLIMGFVCLIGLSYMLCQNQNFHLAAETSKLQRDLQQIQARNRDLELDLQRMKTVPELRRRLAAIHSELVDVNRLVCVRLDQPNRASLVRTGLIDAVVEDQRPNMQYRNRAFVLLVLLACGFTVISLKLVQIQFVQHDKFAQIALLKHMRPVEIVPPRGSIVDAENKPLVQTQSVYDVYLDWQLLPQADELLAPLALAIDVPVDALQQKFNAKNRRWPLAKDIDELTLGRLKALNLKRALIVEAKQKRVYLNDSVAAHVLGFYDNDDHGNSVGAGVEKMMNARLAGIPGKQWVEQDVRGREIAEYSGMNTPAVDGNQVQLTINLNLQHLIEDELDSLVQKYQPEATYIIMMQPHTGAILALASRPTFNPNDRSTYTPNRLRNRCITDMVEPGSIFKIITLAAGLNERLFNLNTQIFCENGVYKFAGSNLNDDEPFGWLSVRDCFANSSNIGMAKLAINYLHEDKLYNYATRFGIGQRTGIFSDDKEFQGESVGLLRPVAKWSGLSISRIPMGQEVAATPIQMITAMSVIANGGRLVMPHLVSEVCDADGNVVQSFSPKVVRQVISPDAAKQVTRALEAVVTTGTAKNAVSVPGYSMAGKTGTAQKFIDGHYSTTQHVASFLGFFPADDPQVVMLVMVDDPKTAAHRDYGADVAAPAFAHVARQAVQILNIAPDQPISTLTDNSHGGAAL